MRTINKIFKLDKEKFKIPRCVQDIITIKAIWEDGIFQVSKNKFSKSFKFMDINYAVASKEDKEALFADINNIIGKKATCTYFYLSDDGIPLQPVWESVRLDKDI